MARQALVTHAGDFSESTQAGRHEVLARTGGHERWQIGRNPRRATLYHEAVARSRRTDKRITVRPDVQPTAVVAPLLLDKLELPFNVGLERHEQQATL